MIEKLKQQFPVGTPVIVREESKTGTGTFGSTEVVGTVLAWRYATTGAWYAKNGDPKTPNTDGKLQLLRLLLRKVDGERTEIVVDDLTCIATLEAKSVEWRQKT